MFAAYLFLRSLEVFLPIPTKISLAQSLLLDYADACYPDFFESLLNKLESLQNLCIRFIFGLRKFDHIFDRSKHGRLPLQLLIEEKKKETAVH